MAPHSDPSKMPDASTASVWAVCARGSSHVLGRLTGTTVQLRVLGPYGGEKVRVNLSPEQAQDLIDALQPTADSPVSRMEPEQRHAGCDCATGEFFEV